MTLREAYKQGERLLEEAGVENAGLDAWYLLEHVTGTDKAAYYAEPDKVLIEWREKQYMTLAMRRAERIPLQHLTGVQEFMGLEFQVNEHVLIPRQDTEVLVETALWAAGELACQRKEKVLGILDLCTGSGCVLLSFLHHVRKQERTSGICCQGLGSDISQKAVETACMNAKLLGISAEFLCSDLFAHVQGTYEIIVSNPPYIKTEDIHGLQEEVRKYDPLSALDGKEDGLFFYKEITARAGRYLVPGGYLIFEIGCLQGEAVTAIMHRAGFRKVLIQKDLAGLDRVVTGVYDKDFCSHSVGVVRDKGRP